MNRVEYLHKVITTAWQFLKKYELFPPESDAEQEQFFDGFIDAFVSLADAAPRESVERQFMLDVMTATSSYFQRKNRR